MAVSKTKTNFMICTKILVFATFFFSSHKMVTGQCQGNIQDLIEQCSRYVQRPGPTVNPSPGCCSVVKNVDLACVCQYITKDVEQIVSMEKAAFVAQACSKPLPHGTKCGSYTVP